ncbi:hypothetical protein MCUN1_003196 [Malassezia cuniculi]|uniref:Bud22 domain-containing protein n=1 Tax=Malassezia cuniculi TaxID=948313 RepID=A0AAF0EX29_9BASI|nr:hypothetical protein MCUN1_003196 [Malassezia cuniculi]
MLKADGTDALRNEVATLKALDLQALATRALLSKLTKQGLLPKKNVIESGDVQSLDQKYPLYAAAREEGLFESNTSADERLVHQVLSAKVLADDLAVSVTALNNILNPEAKRKGDKAQAKENKERVDAKTKKSKKSTNEGRATVPQTKGEDQQDDYDSDTSVRDIEVADDGDSDEYSDAENTMPRNLDSMVASGSDTDADDLDSQQSDDDFLPSLATGFIPAKDGDDWSDGDAEYADSGTKGPPKSMRKNRRGQRERRAMQII